MRISAGVYIGTKREQRFRHNDQEVNVQSWNVNLPIKQLLRFYCGIESNLEHHVNSCPPVTGLIVIRVVGKHEVVTVECTGVTHNGDCLTEVCGGVVRSLLQINCNARWAGNAGISMMHYIITKYSLLFSLNCNNKCASACHYRSKVNLFIVQWPTHSMRLQLIVNSNSCGMLTTSRLGISILPSLNTNHSPPNPGPLVSYVQFDY